MGSFFSFIINKFSAAPGSVKFFAQFSYVDSDKTFIPVDIHLGRQDEWEWLHQPGIRQMQAGSGGFTMYGMYLSERLCTAQLKRSTPKVDRDHLMLLHVPQDTLRQRQLVHGSFHPLQMTHTIPPT
jgi:hypothetical protein